MKSTCAPSHVIFVGLDPNQHGQAASHEHASSSWPVIFHGVLSAFSSAARAAVALNIMNAVSEADERKNKDVGFIAQKFSPKRYRDKLQIIAAPKSVRGRINQIG